MSASSVTTRIPPAPTRESLIGRYPLVAFFALAYAFSWLITLPLLLGGNGIGLLPYTVPRGVALLLIIVQSFRPTVSGLVMASLAGDGGAEPLEKLPALEGWRPLVSCGLRGAAALDPLRRHRGPRRERLAEPSARRDARSPDARPGLPAEPGDPVFYRGPLGEEGGWRGFVLPRMQKQYGPLAATIILGLLWVAWHLPNFFIPEMGTFQGNALLNLMAALGMSVIHTWVFNHANNSLLLVTLLHAAVDASPRTLLPIIFGTDRAAGNLVPLIGFGVWALLVVALTGARLGYRPEAQSGDETIGRLQDSTNPESA